MLAGAGWGGAHVFLVSVGCIFVIHVPLSMSATLNGIGLLISLIALYNLDVLQSASVCP